MLSVKEVTIIWIKFLNPALESIYEEEVMPERDEPLELSSNQTVQVPEELGNRLVEYYDTCIPYVADRDTDSAESAND